ncbi:uncharacterized protein LOC18447323 [Amborella trichopoda]|uniref:uncharacterized protein LOC18447323 n=1 Tax=Amborella trichopoda TaxID=13333 RepID=UPI0005D2F7A4|nr:uncharacterized protein LOC18447323 [Amborella trichopoda]|eukprot:XP_011628196.1 uncharacterized protein LOC18447323 [Amborella trichopoda]
MAQWRIIPRPLLETVLNNYGRSPKVPQPLIFHGPRGAGKTTILHRLLDNWCKPPHATAYLDLHSLHSNNNHPRQQPPPQWHHSPPTISLTSLRIHLEQSLEALTLKAIRLGSISSSQVYTTLLKWHGIDSALRQILNQYTNHALPRAHTADLWRLVISTLHKGNQSLETERRARLAELRDWFDVLSPDSSVYVHPKGGGFGLDVKNKDEEACFEEALLALRLAKEVLCRKEKWREGAIRELNRNGGFSRSLTNAATDWPSLLLELLSASSELGFFQPKLIINNIDILRKAVLTDNSMVNASMYHDSFLWRLVSLGVNERCLPVILSTSDSYYSYHIYRDFAFPDVFISRENYGWTVQEAKMHMVDDFFSEEEWTIVADVLGPNPRHLSELYSIMQTEEYERIEENDLENSFEDVVDAYLAHLQVTVVNPAMEAALIILQNFAFDASNGKISEDRLRFGAPWRHPPHSNSKRSSLFWAKLQLMDFIQSLVNTGFGVNYFADCSLEILDDPCTNAMLEVGLLYMQRDPSYIRPISRGIQRCLIRWLVQEKMQLRLGESALYMWHRVFRGRSYRHLLKEIGYSF